MIASRSGLSDKQKKLAFKQKKYYSDDVIL